MKTHSHTEFSRDGIRHVVTASFCILAIALLLTGCSSEESKVDEGQAKIINPENEQDSTKYYKYHIIFNDPVREPILADTIKRIAETEKEQFLQKLPEDTSQFYVTPWELRIEFHKAFESPRFTSYLKEFYAFTGGAHGMPATQTLTLDKEKNTFVSLSDIFQDTTALQPVSQYAMDQIALDVYDKKTAGDLNASNQEWLMEGASPTTNNYSTFLPARPENDKATGVEIIFSPYQVGPYAIGMPRVFIPASVFYDNLNTEYRSAFEH